MFVRPAANGANGEGGGLSANEERPSLTRSRRITGLTSKSFGKLPRHLNLTITVEFLPSSEASSQQTLQPLPCPLPRPSLLYSLTTATPSALQTHPFAITTANHLSRCPDHGLTGTVFNSRYARHNL